MDDSILPFVKQSLGVNELENAFDPDILMYVNMTFSTLYQLGVGDHSKHVDGTETWNDVFYGYEDLLGFIVTYTVMKVRVMFDPPSSSFVLDALNRQIQELEWRIKEQAEGGFENGE